MCTLVDNQINIGSVGMACSSKEAQDRIMLLPFVYNAHAHVMGGHARIVLCWLVGCCHILHVCMCVIV